MGMQVREVSLFGEVGMGDHEMGKKGGHDTTFFVEGGAPGKA